MKPIQDMEYRVTKSGNIVSGIRLVATKAPLTEHCEMRALAALPKALRALLATGSWTTASDGGVWHSTICWERRRASCSDDCFRSREALMKCGVDVG